MKCEECGSETEVTWFPASGEQLCYHCILALASDYFYQQLFEPATEELNG